MSILANYFQRGGAEIYYEWAGSGPPVVLLHAGIADSRMWDLQFEAFAESHTVVRFDARGYGRTRPVAGNFSQREDLRALLTLLDITRPSLVGCSMGSRTALDFALRYPHRLDRLVLVSPAVSGFRYQGRPSPLWYEIEAAEIADDMARVNELEIQMWVDGPRRRPEHVTPWVRALALEMNAIALAHTGVGREDPALSAEGRLHQVTAPTLLVVGEEDTPWTRAEANWLMKFMDGARRVDVPDAGHLVNMEQPAAFNEVVLGFLKEGP